MFIWLCYLPISMCICWVIYFNPVTCVTQIGILLVSLPPLPYYVLVGVG